MCSEGTGLMKRLTEDELIQIWSEHDADGMATPSLGERLPEELDRSLLIDPPPPPFGLLDDMTRLAALRWLVENVSLAPSGPAVYVTARQINTLVESSVDITLTDTQLCEALLILGMEPWDTTDWVYRIHRDCPAASVGERYHVADIRAVD